MSRGSAAITRLMLDALKPREVSITDLALALGEIEGISSVDIYVTEVDAKTETLKITLEGDDIPLEAVEETMSEYSTAIRSIDGVSARKRSASSRD